MTEQKKRLKELTANTNWQEVNNMRRWNCINKPQLSLAHIHYTAMKYSINPSAELKRQLEKFIHMYPEYKVTGTVERNATNLIMATAFYMEGYMEDAPISNYYLYLIWSDWVPQRQIRDKRKLKDIMYNKMVSLGLIKLLFEESLERVINKGYVLTGHYDKPNTEYTDMEEAYSKATLGFGETPWDR